MDYIISFDITQTARIHKNNTSVPSQLRYNQASVRQHPASMNCMDITVSSRAFHINTIKIRRQQCNM
jgi:hypothetical protein